MSRINRSNGESFTWDDDFLDHLDHLESYTYAHVGLKTIDFYEHPDIAIRISLSADQSDVTFEVEGPHEHLANLREMVQPILQSTVTEDRLRKLAPLQKVFIGHGNNDDWLVVRAYLREAGYHVDAFEEADMVGKATLEQVILMIRSSRAAILVMNQTDEMKDGTMRTRQNVVHELGLAQAFLGPDRTITLREGDVVMPSNLAGITYIPYPVGKIGSSKAEVLASLENKIGRGAPEKN